jgi:hypothetical protein
MPKSGPVLMHAAPCGIRTIASRQVVFEKSPDSFLIEVG